jgi:glycerol-3-phosphate dehydrogenase
MMNRQDVLESLKTEFDVLIIGGGITGVGAARDAAYRGLKVALIEMHDLAYGTSSRSSKLVHGGLRYLENFEFGLVFEAVSERQTLMDIAPHLVHPLGFIFPIRKDSRRSAFTINVGMWVYDALALFRSPKIHRNLTPKQVKVEEPALDADNLKGAPLYYDCSTDDARLTIETALDAVQYGATVATYMKAVEFIRDGEKLSGVVAKDLVSDELVEIRAKAIINCTGPWSDDTRSLGKEVKRRQLRPTKGVHIVVESEKLRINNAVVCFHPEDGRVLFAIPWGDRTYIGTTDTDYSESLEDLAATKEDVVYLLQAANAYFPANALTEEDVISTWAGVRPLVAEESGDDEQSESSISREHSIRVDPNGLITIAGGKLTTYRRMAKEVVQHAVDQMKKSGADFDANGERDTGLEPLIGAVGWPSTEQDVDNMVHKLMSDAQQKLALSSAKLLLKTYGMRAFDIAKICVENPELARPLLPESDRGEIVAQVHFSVKQEMAMALEDVMIRRTQLFFKDRNQGLDCIDAVANEMATLLKWDEVEKDAQIERYKVEVQRSRRWRDA